MTDSPFLDTNVLLYSVNMPKGNTPDPRSERAERILSLGGVVSVQVLNEFSDIASRKWKLNWEKIVGFLQVFESICGRALPLTADTQAAAVAISRRYGYRIYDSTILAAAVEAGCSTLLTEDMQHGQLIEGVRIENPFLRYQ
jgi:predicted nucleic acid-binding protein